MGNESSSWVRVCLGSSVMFLTTFIVILLAGAGFSIAPLSSVSFLGMALALAFLVTGH